jgi:hypothetical protein
MAIDQKEEKEAGYNQADEERSRPEFDQRPLKPYRRGDTQCGQRIPAFGLPTVGPYLLRKLQNLFFIASPFSGKLDPSRFILNKLVHTSVHAFTGNENTEDLMI